MTMKEKMARAMCRRIGINPDGVQVLGVPPEVMSTGPIWKAFLPYVEGALEALAVPTDSMLLAALAHQPKAFNLQATKDVFWPAMIRAAQEGK